MKKVITVMLLSLPLLLRAGSHDNILGTFYITNLPTKVLLCDFLSDINPAVYKDATTGKPTLKIAKQDIKFTVVGFTTYDNVSYAVIKFWNYKTSASTTKLDELIKNGPPTKQKIKE